MPRITKLKTIAGGEIGSWYDSTGIFDVFPDARRYLADWANCEYSDIDYVETEGGEFFFVEDEPVAYLEWKWVPMQSDIRSPGPVVDLRPLMAAE